MPTKQIMELGRGGIIKDLPAVLLPDNAFSDGLNIRFDNESVETITGEIVSNTLNSFQADYGFHWNRPDQGYNIYLKDGNAIRVDSAKNQSSVIVLGSGVDYNDSVWQSTYFNGGYAVVINNGRTTPKYMLYGDLNYSNTFAEIPGWNYFGGLEVTARVIKPLGYSLVAANLTINDNGTIINAPSTIRISVQAVTGRFPSTWEPGTTTDTADELEINCSSPILDMGELRGNMYIYSSDNIHVLSINTGISRVQPYAIGYGILNTNCFAEFDGKHFVVDKNDIYTHSGSGGIQSVADMRMRDYFFSNLNRDHSDKVFVKRNARNDEIWVCYPKGSSSLCNEALIYQYRNNTWSIRELPNVVSMFEAPVNESNLFSYSDNRLHMLLGNYKVLQADTGYEMWSGSDLVPYDSYIAREKLNSGDTLGSVYISGITPVFDNVPVDASINITVTGQNNYVSNADWSNASGRDTLEFLPNDDSSQGYKVNPRTTGRLLNYKISSASYWRLALIGIDVAPADRR